MACCDAVHITALTLPQLFQGPAHLKARFSIAEGAVESEAQPPQALRLSNLQARQGPLRNIRGVLI